MERTPIINLGALPRIAERPMTVAEAAAAFGHMAVLARLEAAALRARLPHDWCDPEDLW